MKSLTKNTWDLLKPNVHYLDPLEVKCYKIMSECGDKPFIPPFLRNK